MELVKTFVLITGHLRFVMKVNENWNGFAEVKRHWKISGLFFFIASVCWATTHKWQGARRGSPKAK